MTTMHTGTQAQDTVGRVVATAATVATLAIAAAIGFRHDVGTPQKTNPTVATSATAPMSDTGTKTAGRLIIYITSSEETAMPLRSLLAQQMQPSGIPSHPTSLVLVTGSAEAENLANLPVPPDVRIIDARADATGDGSTRRREILVVGPLEADAIL